MTLAFDVANWNVCLVVQNHFLIHSMHFSHIQNELLILHITNIPHSNATFEFGMLVMSRVRRMHGVEKKVFFNNWA